MREKGDLFVKKARAFFELDKVVVNTWGKSPVRVDGFCITLRPVSAHSGRLQLPFSLLIAVLFD